MPEADPPLIAVYRGWGGYQTSLVRAVENLTPEHLAFRAAPDSRSVGEIARHISTGRIDWFLRIAAPRSAELAAQIPEWNYDPHGNRYAKEDFISLNTPDLTRWLKVTGAMVQTTLEQWRVSDLERTYRHTFRGTTYTVSYQWTIWRILSHDIHHGGQLSELLYMQNVDLPDLGWQGGHIVEVSKADREE